MATEAERLEFEQQCAAYPEIAEARNSFERSLEAELMKDAPAPPAFIKARIFEVIQPKAAPITEVEETYEAPVRSMNNSWKWMAAASLVLLAGTAIWGYNNNKKYNDLLARQAATEKELAQSTAQLQTLQQDADMLRKPGVKMVSLKGTPDAPQAFTTVYWDTTGTNKDVYLMINNLPQPPSEKQYQLWALLEGKPIDLGVFNYDISEKRLLVRMKNVQKAQAFAITLEEKGGKPAPEGPIYVVGNL